MTPSGQPGEPLPGAHRVTWTYALSRADLARLLPRLLAPQPVVLTGDRLHCVWPDGRQLSIEFGAETERRLASLRLRDTTFTFVFEAWDEAQIRAFLVHCARRLQQGGG